MSEENKICRYCQQERGQAAQREIDLAQPKKAILDVLNAAEKVVAELNACKSEIVTLKAELAAESARSKRVGDALGEAAKALDDIVKHSQGYNIDGKKRPFTKDGLDMCPYNWQTAISNAVDALVRIRAAQEGA